MTWSILTVLSTLVLMLYCFMIIGFTVGWRRLKQIYIPASYLPLTKISVIIPVRNEEATIRILLEDIINQDFPLDLVEIFVVDDHSEDNTVQEVDRLISTVPNGNHIKLLKLSSLDQELISKKNAITKGISLATGDLIVLTDGDCRVPRSWLRNYAYHYETGHYEMIVGPVVLSIGSLWNRFQGLEFLSLVVSAAGGIGTGRPFMCNGANLAFSKGAFMEVDGYKGNEEVASGDDVFLLHKIKKRYGAEKIGFLKSREAIVSTEPARGIISFFAQRIRWAGKSKHYKDAFTVYVAALVFVLNIVITGSAILGYVSTEYLVLACSLLAVKMLFDLQMLIPAAKTIGMSTATLFLYIPLAVIYPLYVTVTGTIAMIVPGRWKGRR